MTELAYIVKLAPVTKKNSQKIAVNRVSGRPFIMQSEQYKRFEEAAGWFLKPRPAKPVAQPVNVKYLFYMPSRRRVDLANLISAMDDVLVKHRILADDNRDILAAHDGCRVYHDHDAPRVEVLIEPMPDSYRQWKE